MHIASVFLGTGVTYFMSPLDTQIIEKNIKRWFEHLPTSVRDREARKSMDGSRTLAISCEKRRETASGHAGYPVKSSVSSSKYA